MNRSGRNILALTMLKRGATDGVSNNERRHGRVRIEAVRCSLGEVLDLSRSGMRILTRRPFRAEAAPDHRAVIEAFDERLDLPCRVVWVKKAGLFKYETGFEFGELTDDQSDLLCRIARTAASNAHLHSRRPKRAS